MSGLPAACTAAVASDPYRTELRELPVPEIGDDDGLLRVEAAAVCGTDWEIYGRQSRGAGLGPLVLGHENVGRIVALGQAAARRWAVRVGDRVAVEEFLPCGSCRLCRDGNYRICSATDSRSTRPFLRYGSTPVTVPPALYGGFSEYLYLHPRAIVYPVGDQVDAEMAALFVPLGNGIRWVCQEGGLQVGSTLVVIGPGQHGLGCVVAGREAGAGRIIVVGTEHDAHRLDVAKALGADHTLIGGTADVASSVHALTEGAGADLVVDLAPGVTATVSEAVAMAAKRATIALASSKHRKPLTDFDHDAVVRNELRVIGVRGHDHNSVEPAIRIIHSGRYPLELLATHTFGLAQTDQALRVAGTRSDPAAIHVSIHP